MDIVSYILLNIVIILIVFVLAPCCFLLMKNAVTLKNREIIIDAIYRYNIDVIRNRNIKHLVDYNDMESYDDTLFRIFDFGYTNILPKDKYELVKPFIDKKEEK